ncbi:MAG: polysaccharide biosynthesis protein [Phycisphaerales bacterium]|nr:polysaccharide biosynthesis protein [Phycisphaerales bacterium]
MPPIPEPCILIGTAQTLLPLSVQAASQPGLAAPLGWVLVGPGRPPGGRILGFAQDKALIHRAAPFASAIACVPEAHRREVSMLRAQLTELGVHQVWVPALEDALHAAASPVAEGPSPLTSTIRWEQLISREPHPVDRASIARVLSDKRVLITGAGGSIGSEIARIAASYSPELLILMERSENALFEIDRQIARRFPRVPRKAVLHDVVDADATLRRLVEHRPHAVFHAAAHKHVPLMEEHPAHALTNNLFGTKSIADAALAVGAERFVLISSDKAVNPTSVMGATKRLAEIYVRGLARRSRRAGVSGTGFAMVRFGNVLGSAGSVIPIWSAQLAEGGPITVTDPRMTRYFMTIPEAAALVIQASAIEEPADEAPVYVLDMGQPVRILDLACRFALAHGFEPRLVAPQGGDVEWTRPWGMRAGATPVDVVISGARPGEKVHEELAYDRELLRDTPYQGIHSWIADDADPDLLRLIADLSAARNASDSESVMRAIRTYVPEMQRVDALRRAG